MKEKKENWPRILIVNKDEAYWKLFIEMVKMSFPAALFTVAADAGEATDLIRNERFDILITELFFESGMFFAVNGVELSDTVPEGVEVIRCARENGVLIAIVTSILCSAELPSNGNGITLKDLSYRNGAHCVLDDGRVFEKPVFLGQLIYELLGVESGWNSDDYKEVGEIPQVHERVD